MTLNASAVLREFSDNENLFQLLIQHDEFKKLVGVCAQFDTNRMNMPYAHHMLNNMLAQFYEQEPHFFKDGDKEKAFEVVKPFVNDICYNCLIVLRSDDSISPDVTYENQAAQGVRKLGIHRIRAIEQIKCLIAAISRVHGVKASGLIGDNLRRKIIETMLYLIKTYHFCSIAHQQSLVIFNYLKELFDEQDISTLWKFVKVCFDGDTRFTFPTTRVASGMIMGQVTKIAFELRQVMQQSLDAMNSSDDEDELNEEEIKKREEISYWNRFCKDKIDRLYKIWETKLGSDPVSGSDTEGSDDEKAGEKIDDDDD